MADNIQITPGCVGRVYRVDDSCGCALTAATIEALTPEDILAWGNLAVDLSRVYADAHEARTLGVRESNIADLLNSRIKSRAHKNPVPDGISMPWEPVRQTQQVNATVFQIVDGGANADAGVGDTPDSATDLVIEVTDSPWATGITNLARYMLEGMNLNVRYTAGDGSTKTFNVTILSASNTSETQATVVVKQNMTDTAWGALSGGEQAVFQPNHGTVRILANSIDDFESWCHNPPVENNLGVREVWRQTMRTTRCFHDSYMKALEAGEDVNLYFREFKHLPWVKQEAQRRIFDRNAELNTYLFGDEISEKQTTATYRELPQITDPEDDSCVLGFKSNTLGIQRLLQDCGKFVDLASTPLDIDTLFDLMYVLMRHRKTANKSNAEIIEWMTDRFTAGIIHSIMIAYYKATYQIDSITKYVEMGKVMEFNGLRGFKYDSYEIPKEGFVLRIIRDEWFDDHLSQAATADKPAHRHMMAVDWSDIEVWLYGTSSKNRTNNLADNLYNCVIRENIKHYELMSKTVAVYMEDPNQHLWVTGFTDECPTVSTTVCAGVTISS